MSVSPIRIGQIGPRGFGAFCAGAYHEDTAGRVVAFAGRDAANLRELAAQYDVAKTTTDWRELLSDPEIDLIHIVTPPALHAEMAVAAMEAGKHVLVEKPLATSQEDAQAIVDAARRTGRRAGVNYVMRYSPIYEAVERIARSGALGAISHIGFENYASDTQLHDAHWFWDKSQAGGIFVEHGVHFFDIFGAVIPSPAQRVLGKTWVRDDGTGKEDRVQAIVSYANGAEATYYHAFNRPGALERQRANLAFERGHVTVEGWTPTRLTLDAAVDADGAEALRAILPVEPVSGANPPPVLRGRGRDYPTALRVRAEQDLGDPTPLYRDGVKRALADLAQAIRDPQHRLRVDAADGAASLAVALAAARSAEIGREEGVG